MTNEDRQLIVDFKVELDAIAKKAQTLFSRGFITEFNVNIQSGAVDNFKVMERVEISLADLQRKPS